MILDTSTSSLTCIYQSKCNDGHIRWWAGLSDIFVKSINKELFKPRVWSKFAYCFQKSKSKVEISIFRCWKY